ncbi:hypothetical protein [Streptomyces sp. NPDC051776]|uniref:hypothetical protein n=1 Tax=Streptomyces sp. NPDC051776 TaxID=3155414 RepID=UPI0034349522
MFTTSGVEAARERLAAADPDLPHAERWFANVGVALLPVGRSWDAVRVDGPLANTVLSSGIAGPVIRDHDSMYFLVPSGTSAAWAVRGSAALGPACYVAVPSPERTTGPGVHWAQAPDGSGALVNAAALRLALEGAAL